MIELGEFYNGLASLKSSEIVLQGQPSFYSLLNSGAELALIFRGTNKPLAQSQLLSVELSENKPRLIVRSQR